MLAATGAGRVDLVGHSQGGMMPRYYLKYLGGAAKVHTLVGLAPSNHGTTLNGLFTLAGLLPGASAFTGSFCPACEQQSAGSAFLTDLNSGGETVAGRRLHVDRVALRRGRDPLHLGLPQRAERDQHPAAEPVPLDLGEHLSMPYDHIADGDVLTALDPAHPVHPSALRSPRWRAVSPAIPRPQGAYSSICEPIVTVRSPGRWK